MHIPRDVEIATTLSDHILLDSRRGVYWHLNTEGMRFLEALQAGISVDDFVSEVANQTGADLETVRKDHAQTLRTLVSARLVTGISA